MDKDKTIVLILVFLIIAGLGTLCIISFNTNNAETKEIKYSENDSTLIISPVKNEHTIIVQSRTYPTINYLYYNQSTNEI